MGSTVKDTTVVGSWGTLNEKRPRNLVLQQCENESPLFLSLTHQSTPKTCCGIGSGSGGNAALGLS